MNRMPRQAKNQKQEIKTQPNTDWQLFDLTVNQVRQAFADVPADQVLKMIDDAVAMVRKAKHRERKVRSQS